jgi:hypothetical protein
MAFRRRETVHPIITKPETGSTAYHNGLGIVSMGDVLPLA